MVARTARQDAPGPSSLLLYHSLCPLVYLPPVQKRQMVKHLSQPLQNPTPFLDLFPVTGQLIRAVYSLGCASRDPAATTPQGEEAGGEAGLIAVKPRRQRPLAPAPLRQEARRPPPVLARDGTKMVRNKSLTTSLDCDSWHASGLCAAHGRPFG